MVDGVFLSVSRCCHFIVVVVSVLWAFFKKIVCILFTAYCIYVYWEINDNQVFYEHLETQWQHILFIYGGKVKNYITLNGQRKKKHRPYRFCFNKPSPSPRIKRISKVTCLWWINKCHAKSITAILGTNSIAFHMNLKQQQRWRWRRRRRRRQQKTMNKAGRKKLWINKQANKELRRCSI